MMRLDIRLAQGIAALPEVSAVRETVFIDEQGFDYDRDDIDETAWHALVTVDGEPAAAGRMFPIGGGACKIGRIAALPRYRGQKLGRAVMEALEGKAAELGAEKIELSAQVRARGFYEHIGYTATGAEYDEDGCPHVKMSKTL